MANTAYKKGMFKGKKVTIMGLGLLGRGVGDAKFFAEEGAHLIVTDLKTREQLKMSLSQLKRFKNITYTLGEHDVKDFENRDFILKAAGVPIDSPYIAHARKSNVPVYMSTALFVSLTPVTIVGITGTRGKTTVTHMIYEVLKDFYKSKAGKIYLGGNIQGMATLPLIRKVKKGDIVVLELDSWQLQGFGDMKISPQLALFTTFMPDHLNYYKGNLKTYFADKAKIFTSQKKGDIFLSGDQLKKQKLKLPKSTMFVGEKDLPKSLKLLIPGTHNRYNAALAYKTLQKLGLKEEDIVKGLQRFKGVKGRLEYLRTYKGVDIYNDTTATTPHALVSALEAVGKKRNVILLMGGSDKTINLKILSAPLDIYVKEIFLIPGTGSDRLKKEKVIPKSVKVTEDIKFTTLVKNAIGKAKKGDVLLLSPGFASFGMFKNEYDRGGQFVSLVKKFAK